MSSLYPEFLKEVFGLETLEDSDSFVTYEIQEISKIKCIKIINMYIKNQARGKNKSRDLLDKVRDIGLELKCNSISAQVNKASNEFIQQRTTHICRLYGMQNTYEDSQIIIFSRSL